MASPRCCFGAAANHKRFTRITTASRAVGIVPLTAADLEESLPPIQRQCGDIAGRNLQEHGGTLA